MQRKTREAGWKTPQVMNVDVRQKDVASLTAIARVLLVELSSPPPALALGNFQVGPDTLL